MKAPRSHGLAAIAMLALASCTSPPPPVSPPVVEPAPGAASVEPVGATPAASAPANAPAKLPKHPLAVAFLVDRSASMQGPRLAAARSALVHVSARLAPDDVVEVVTFDAHAKVVVPPTPVSGLDLAKPLSGLGAGSGTDFYEAIDLAHADLFEVDAARRHVVLITDGAAKNAALTSAVRAMVMDGIGLSTIGLAGDVDEAALEDLAKRGEGRAWIVLDPKGLEPILEKELEILKLPKP